MLLDARTGQCLWTHCSIGDTTLSGELPSLRGRGDLLFYVQPANVGYYLQRLDRATGGPVWPRPRLLTAKTVDPNAWNFDAEAVYGIEDHRLIARSRADGEVLWRRTLPAGAVWQARRIGDYLVVIPHSPTRVARFRFRLPLGAVQWVSGSLLAPGAVSPMSCYDPKTGQLIERLNFRIETPVRTVLAKRRIQEENSPAWMVRTSSLLASADGPVVRLASPQPFVALGREVWGLTGSRLRLSEPNR